MKKYTPSLRQQMSLIILLCWLLPMALAATLVGWYLLSGAGRQKEQAISQQFQLNLQLVADRVNSAVEASRLPSYDPEFREAWNQYRQDGNYAMLYRRSSALFGRLYQSDSRFLYGVFCFAEDPEARSIAVVNGSSGLHHNQARELWRLDAESVWALAEELDTTVGFLEREGRVYLVRNLMDASYRPVGVLALVLNRDYFFGDLALLPWAAEVSVSLEQEAFLTLKGDAPLPPGNRTLEYVIQDRDYSLRGTATVDYAALFTGAASYRWLLPAMGLSLLLLLLFTFRFFRQKISRPIRELMEGAARIRQGELGYQIEEGTGSREFQYLTGSFNQMSGQLRHLFDRIYQEELARRDAQIKALQAHINPHFLNNTLEIINWQARMSGDVKASKMIEALSTVLDAALARRGSPQVRLAEEMTYVNAYLYIVKERFGKRLTVDVDLPDELMDCLVPRLILQPVIENAVEHGIGPSGQGRVILRGAREGDRLVLEIENNGGLSAEDEAHILRLLSPNCDTQNEPSGNIGIANVNQRLRILYGPDCGLTITRGEGRAVIARMTIGASACQPLSFATSNNRQ